MNGRISPPWHAWTQHQYADMLLRRGGKGDREKALSLATQALDTAQRLSMVTLVERALALKLRAQGIDAARPQTSIDAVAASAYVEKAELLREHNAIVRQQVKSHGGFEVKSEGDGFMLAFQSARRALQCAIDIQRAFAERNEAAEEAIRVRIGLHTGEAIKEGDDFFGKHVTLAVCVAGQAQGGQILVSSLLKELTE